MSSELAVPTITEILTAFGLDLSTDEVQIAQATSLKNFLAKAPFEGGLFPWSPYRPLLIIGPLESSSLLLLLNLRGYVASNQLFDVIPAQTLRSQEISAAQLGETSQIIAALLPTQDPLENGTNAHSLQHVVARLRDENGCPWDRKQTMTSLRDSFIDEIYEAIDAIDAEDWDNLAEELGDLFLIIAMQAQIAHEHGYFALEDVFARVTTKIVGRHPHVFGDEIVQSHADLMHVWNTAKAKEGKPSTKAEDGEPHAMPAIERVNRVLRKRSTGDQTAINDLLNTLTETDQQLRAALIEYARTTPKD